MTRIPALSETFADVLESPAVALVVQLESDGLQLSAVGDRLRVKPIAQLGDDQRAELNRLRGAVLVLLHICDEAVQARRAAFAEQLDTDRGVVPRFVFRGRAIYTAGECYSCGDAAMTRGCRCWRCVLALRLACRAPIPSDFPLPVVA